MPVHRHETFCIERRSEVIEHVTRLCADKVAQIHHLQSADLEGVLKGCGPGARHSLMAMPTASPRLIPVVPAASPSSPRCIAPITGAGIQDESMRKIRGAALGGYGRRIEGTNKTFGFMPPGLIARNRR